MIDLTALEVAKQCSNNYYANPESADWDKYIENIITAYLSALGVEPVAWLIEHPSEGKEVELARYGSLPITSGDEADGYTALPLYAAPAKPGMVADYFGSLVEKSRASAEKASRKFPQPNYVALKIAEEAGEVVRGCVHYAEGRMGWAEVESEIVQLLAMLIRLVTEGDQINGVTPPAMLAAAKEA